MHDNEHIGDLYRAEMDGLEIVPEPGVWAGLEDSLDLEEVWGRLENSLQQGRRRKLAWLWAAQAASVIMFCMLGAMFLAELGAHRDAGRLLPSGTVFNVYPPSALRPMEILQCRPAQKEGPSNNLAVGKSRENSAFTQKILPDNRQPVGIPQYRRTNEALMALRPRRAQLIHEAPMREADGLGLPLPLSEDLLPFTEPRDPKHVAKSRKFYIGSAMGLKNQWLLNHDTYNGLRADRHDMALIDFSGVLGLQAGISVSSRLGLQADYMFLSSNGQKYEEYAAGKVLPREVDLRYHKLILSSRFQRGNWNLLGRNMSDHFHLGIYGGRLSEAEQVLGTEMAANAADHYRQWDLGLAGGYEISVLLRPRFQFSTGLRVQQGLFNIYAGTAEQPASFNRTFNASADLLLGLRYTFEKNHKNTDADSNGLAD